MRFGTDNWRGKSRLMQRGSLYPIKDDAINKLRKENNSLLSNTPAKPEDAKRGERKKQRTTTLYECFLSLHEQRKNAEKEVFVISNALKPCSIKRISFGQYERKQEEQVNAEEEEEDVLVVGKTDYYSEKQIKDLEREAMGRMQKLQTAKYESRVQKRKKKNDV